MGRLSRPFISILISLASHSKWFRSISPSSCWSGASGKDAGEKFAYILNTTPTIAPHKIQNAGCSFFSFLWHIAT